MTKKGLLVGSLLTAYTCGSMYVGDKFDVRQNITIPARDWVFQTETADGFAPQGSLDLVTIVNENNERETYLRFDKHEGGFHQMTPVKDNGYATPESIGDRVNNYLRRKQDDLKQFPQYEKLESMNDKVGVAFDYYKIKAKEFFDKIF